MSQFIAQGQYPKYITASGIIKTGPCRLQRIIVNATTTLTATFYDNTSAAGNIIFVLPTAVIGSIYLLDWPCVNGVYVTIGGAGALAISFDDGMSGQ